MSLKNKNKNVVIFLVLVIIIATCFFSIKILNSIKKQLEIDNALTSSISSSDWPLEVPMIKSKYVNVIKSNEKSWEISIKEKISYEEFKTYLIELFSAGFEPITELGSDNPKRLSSNEPTEEGFVLLWCGESDKYSIEAYWTNSNQYISGEEVYIEDCVNILLYANFETNTNIDIDANISQSGDIFSGDLGSGELLQVDVVSGESILNSGE